MEKVLITGGAGFIGSHVCERLLNLEIQVLCIDNFDSFYDPKIKRENIAGLMKNPNFELLELDICNKDALMKTMESNDVNHILHLAARPGVIPSIQNPLATFENNVVGTQNILELAKSKKLEHLILASSSSVYGSRETGPFKEIDAVSKPESPYAASKLMNELMAHAYHIAYGIDVSCLRFFTVYGPKQRPDMAIHFFTEQVMKQGKLKVFGSAETSRDYTYIDDIVDGIIKAMRVKSGFDIYNLGFSKPVFLGDLVNLILKVTSRDVEVEWLPGRLGDVPMTYSDSSKAIRKLGYKPNTSIETGLTKFFDWYKNKA